MAARGAGAGRAKAPTKAQTLATVASETGLTKAQVTSVFDALEVAIADSLKKHKEFTLNGMVKVVVAHKAATKAHPGRNPFTGEDIIIKAKPAHNVVRVRALKRLKDMV